MGLNGCTCCVYYNHMFNAERAWEEANAMQKTRQDSLPADTTLVTSKERVKFDRVIEKCSRVLERYPEEVVYKPRAVFLIAESFRKKGEWDKAINKYDEFERYFVDHDSMPAVEYQRAWCLYQNRDYAVARFALERVMEKGEEHPYYIPGLNLLSLLEEHSNMPDLAIQALQQVLASQSGTPFLRGKMHLRLADLLYAQALWSQALEHYQAQEVQLLDLRDRLRAAEQEADCYVEMKEYQKAAGLYDSLQRIEDYNSRYALFRVRQGETLLQAALVDSAYQILLSVPKDFPKTQECARSWFDLGDWEQQMRKNYPTAMIYYDSAWASSPHSQWGKDARQRRLALQNLDLLRQKAQQTKNKDSVVIPSAKTEFQIAELFLFKLSEVDSALAKLDGLLDSGETGQTTEDSTILLRAAYARAFIWDEYKQDSSRADSMYREIIQRYPGTDFAKQAQSNLGERVTVKTREDLAHDAFLNAEAKWDSLALIPVDSIAWVDSAFLGAMAAFDQVIQEFAGTEYAARAHMAKAFHYEYDAADIDAAKLEYTALRTHYGNTPWGRYATDKLSGKLQITDRELERLRRRVSENANRADRDLRQYEKQMQEKQDQKRNVDQGISADEVLENDYNSLYDFQ